MSTRQKIAFAALGVVLLVTGFLFGFRGYLINRVEKLRTELRARGEKLTVQELRAGIRPPETNGAPALLAAMSQLRTPGEKIFKSYLSMHKLSRGHAIVGWKQPDLRGSSPDRTNSWRDLEAELIELRPTLDAISAALKSSVFDFGLDYSKG